MSSGNGFADSRDREREYDDDRESMCWQWVDRRYSGDWHETYDNVTALGRYLVNDQDYEAESLQLYYERPYRYEEEWRQFLFSSLWEEEPWND